MARRRPTGVVSLVGAGPGDPALITVRGRDRLARAEVVVADALAEPALLRLAPPGAEIIRAGKRGGRRSAPQAAINRLIVARARAGRRVVRLKGGDPLLFGRGGEEAEALARAGVPFEIVPGVTAAIGAAASSGIPLTHRGIASSVALATGHLDPGRGARGVDWKSLAGADTIALYMGVRGLQRTVAALRRAGRGARTPAALVRWATRPDQSVLVGTLGSIVSRARRARLGPPALLIVGDVVRLRAALDWFGRRPLRGRTIVVTRARDQAGPFTTLLAEQGARVIEAPAIALRPPRSWAPVDRALRRLGGFRYLIFTSVNGVERFFARLAERRMDVRALAGLQVVAIGPATAAAIEARGLRVRAVPEDYRAEGVVAWMARRSLRGAGVLIPRAAVARDLLLRELRARGARVEVVSVYRTVPSREGVAEVRAALRAGVIDLLTFASSSSVSAFVGHFRGTDRRRLRAVPAAVIGPITAATARREGLRVVVMPRAYTIPELAAAIVRRFRNSPSGTPPAW
jgi:uroporphyrinogen III methyltransferase / synthase